MMTLVAAFIMALTVSASNKSIENNASDFVRIAPFGQISVNIPGRIRVIQGEEYGIQVTSPKTGDSTMLDYQVKDGVLYIYTENDEMLTGSGSGTVVTIITPANNAVLKTGNNMQIMRSNKK